MSYRSSILFLIVLVVLFASPLRASEEDSHWSREFAKPVQSTKMALGTGLSDGGGKPTIMAVKWFRGKLYMAGSWEPGVSGDDLTQAQRNDYWHVWSWSPLKGYEVVAHFHSSWGGPGPNGKVLDFLFLPDGRLVVGGSFTQLGNPGGNRYHKVNGLGIYDPKEPTANRWKPIGTVQYNGTVSSGGSIYSLAYDEKNNDLYVGGTFAGIRGGQSPKIQKYDFDTGDWVPLSPGVLGAKPIVHKIVVDSSVSPPKVYVGGKFQYTAGNGMSPDTESSTARWSTGFAMYREGEGWTTYPSTNPEKMRKEDILQRAGDYAHFDAVHVIDFLVEGETIWAVGAFSQGEGTGQTLRGIGRWDPEKKIWTDPTGKGGVGREVFSIARAANGKLYFAGAFGGRKGAKDFYEGFKNGDSAHLAMSYDPSTGRWAQLGSGLSSQVMPECRLAVSGNDVFFAGDFQYIDPANFGASGKKDHQSWYLARWNEDVDFTKGKAPLPAGADEPYDLTPPVADTPPFEGNEHWSRRFVKPPRQKAGKSLQDGRTGMDDGFGAPTQITGMGWHGETLYFSGNWEVMNGRRWFVWTWHPEQGWEGIAWQGKGGTSEGPDSPPDGLKWHEGRMYVYGAISRYAGICTFDPKTKTWAQFKGSYQGTTVEGNAVKQRGGAIHDVAWDSKTGDMYLAGSCGLERRGADHPKDVAQVFRVDKGGEYHLMGHMLTAERKDKPILGCYSLYVDETKDPSDIYMGGTFRDYGASPQSRKRMSYNIVKWDHATEDWGPLGKGCFWFRSPLETEWYPEGLPGLPAHPEGEFVGFSVAGFPRVRCITMDREGNLYAGGALALVDASLPVKDRKESFGIVRLNGKTGLWEPCTSIGGFSRDVYQMSWIDDDHLLITGSFVYGENFELLNNVAILNVKSGQVSPLGGGLLRKGLVQTIGCCVVHCLREDGYWFGGFFDHAGVNANSRCEAPVESNFIAHWNPKENLDPNRGLIIKPVQPLEGVKGFSSKDREFVVEAEGISADEGSIVWYEQSRSGAFLEKTAGSRFKATLRVKAGMTEKMMFVAVRRKDGTEGGKIPVRIPITQPE